MTIKAILFDYVGTLVQPRSYSMERSKTKLHRALCAAGLDTEIDEFMDAYAKAHEKYRVVRHEQLKEVTNAIWVSEALCNANCAVTADDSRLKAGLNVFFQDFVGTLELRPNAKQLLAKASENFKIALVSNFTYAPAIYMSLRKLGIDSYFNAVVISEAVGWRKPHETIFNQALRMLRVRADQAVFVGDSPREDIEGAKSVGLLTVFVSSGFNSLKDLEECGVKPDFVVQGLAELLDKLPELLTLA